MPNPSAQAAYEIFRSIYKDLLAGGILVTDSTRQSTTLDSQETIEIRTEPPTQLFPPINVVQLDLCDLPEHPASVLLSIAENADGFCGRNLARLPLIALGLHTYGEPTTVDQALQALKREVQEQKRRETEGVDGFDICS